MPHYMASLPLLQLLALYTANLEFAKGLHTSGPQFTLWILLVCCGVFPFYTYILDSDFTVSNDTM